MDIHDIVRALSGTPFQPMRVVCKDGRFYDISLRELVVVGTTYVDIGQQATGRDPGVCGGIDTVDPQVVLRVEPVASPH
jgi:hypothetical protein